MDLKELLTVNATKEVDVTYPDGKDGHTATVYDIAQRFIEERSEWRENFFNNLLNKGEAFTKFGGRYVLKVSNTEIIEQLETITDLAVAYANKLNISGEHIDQVLHARALIKKLKAAKK